MAILAGSSIGPGEVLLFMLLVLLLFGPKKLPGAARTLGRLLHEMKRMTADFQNQLMNADRPVPRDVADDEDAMDEDKPAPGGGAK